MYHAELSLPIAGTCYKKGFKGAIYIGLGDTVMLSHDFSEIRSAYPVRAVAVGQNRQDFWYEHHDDGQDSNTLNSRNLA